MLKKSLILLAIFCSVYADKTSVEKAITSTNRANAHYELLADEARTLTIARKNALVELAEKAVDQRKQELGFKHIWRDYKTLAMTCLVGIPTFRMLNYVGKKLVGFKEQQSVATLYAAIIPLSGTLAGVITLLDRTHAKARYADSLYLKKVIGNLPAQ